MLSMAPFVMALDKYRRLAQHFVNNIWAKVSTSLFYGVEGRKAAEQQGGRAA
ncbi:1-acyl-sn-glycerol-3-phosphate acyltransferase, partial [Haematococcus lacustris]